MSEDELIADAEALTGWQQHKFLVMIGSTIIISLILVVISLTLYNVTGAAQLDLSRPGYQSVRDKADRSGEFDSFSSTGALDKKALEQFRSLYNDKTKEANTVDAFGGNVMSDKALSIDDPTADEPAMQ
jgi:hypothetical protein